MAASWTLALDLQLIATIREHLHCGDEWRKEEHGDVPWKRLFSKTRESWPSHWSKHELAKRWTDTYRRWFPPPAGSTGRAQRVNLIELEALVRRHHAVAANRKRTAEKKEEEDDASLRLTRPDDVNTGCEKKGPSALLSASEDEYVNRCLPLLVAANKQGHQQCRLRVDAYELDLDWLLKLLTDDKEGDVQQPTTTAETRSYLALAAIVAPQARLSLLASDVHVMLANGSELIISAPGKNKSSALLVTSSRRQMLLAALYVAISGTPPLVAWPADLAAFIWWHLLSKPSVFLVLPPPPLPLPFTSLLQVLDWLGLHIRQWWVAQSLALLPLESGMECLADVFANERQFVLLSLCEDGSTSSTMCQWRKSSTPLTLIAERERRHFGVVLTLMASADNNTVTVVCPTPQSIAHFCVDGVTSCDVPQQLQRLPRRVEFCVDGLVVTIEVPELECLHEEVIAAATPPTLPLPSLDSTAVAASALETLSNVNASYGVPINVQRRRVRELLARIESKLVEKLLRQLWSAARAPDSNLGVATVGPSPQKQTLSSAVSVLLTMGLDTTSRFLDIGSGHGLLPITAALLFNVSQATGIEVERQKFEWSMRALTRLPQREQAVLTFHHVDVCEWPDLREHTHIHAFDYDFPPDVLRHVGKALRRSPCWQVFASCSDQRDWLRLWGERDPDHEMEYWWATNVVLFDKVRISLCGSQARHTLYLFTRAVQVFA